MKIALIAGRITPPAAGVFVRRWALNVGGNMGGNVGGNVGRNVLATREAVRVDPSVRSVRLITSVIQPAWPLPGNK